MKMEVKRKLEDNYQEGLEASDKLIQAGRGDESDSVQTRNLTQSKEAVGEDTVDEAPSIEDEIPKNDEEHSSVGSSVSSTESSSEEDENEKQSLSSRDVNNSSSKSPLRWSTAENVVVMVGAERKLQDAQTEGKEISEILRKTTREEDAMSVGSAVNLKRNLSHFQAMALVGKLFYGMRKANKVGTESSPSRVLASAAGSVETSEEEEYSREELSSSSMTVSVADESNKGPEQPVTIHIEKDDTHVDWEEEGHEATPDGSHRLQVPTVQMEAERQLQFSEDEGSDEGSSTEQSESVDDPTKISDAQALKLLQRLFIMERENVEHWESLEGDDDVSTLTPTEELTSVVPEQCLVMKDKPVSEMHGSGSSESLPQNKVCVEVSTTKIAGEDQENATDSLSKSSAGATSSSESGSSSASHSSSETGEEDQMSRVDPRGNKVSADVEDVEDVEVEEAAINIQSGYGGMTSGQVHKIKAEEHMDEASSSSTEESESEASYSGSSEESGSDEADTKATVEAKEEENQSDLGDSADLAEATTKIQAGYRGMKARRQVKEMRQPSERSASSSGSSLEKNRDSVSAVNAVDTKTDGERQNDELGIDADDPDIERATIMIQAGYKGMKAREEVAQMRMQAQGDTEATKEIEHSSDITSSREHRSEDESPARSVEDINTSESKETVTSTQESETESSTTTSGDDEGDEDSSSESEEISSHSSGSASTCVDEEKTLQDTQEDIDIDLEDPNVEAATTKIQAGYRGMKTRKSMRERAQTSHEIEDSNIEMAEHSPAHDESDANDAEMEEATIKIQAGYRGMKARKDLKKSDTKYQDASATQNATVNDDDVGLLLDDPELEKATTTLQAGYRGMKARRQLPARSKTDQPSASNRETTVYDSANEYTEDSESDSEESTSSEDEDSSSSSERGGGSSSATAETNESNLVKDTLLAGIEDAGNNNHDYDSGTSVGSQDIPRHKSPPEVIPSVPLVNDLIMVEPAEAQNKTVEGLKEPVHGANEETVRSDEEESSASSSRTASSTSDDFVAIATKKTPFGFLKRLLSSIQLTTPSRRHRVGTSSEAQSQQEASDRDLSDESQTSGDSSTRRSSNARSTSSKRSSRASPTSSSSSASSEEQSSA